MQLPGLSIELLFLGFSVCLAAFALPKVSQNSNELAEIFACGWAFAFKSIMRIIFHFD